jgi:hypothetical protein
MNALAGELSSPMTGPVRGWRISIPSVIIGILYCLFSWAIGHTSPIFSEIYQSFGVAVTWQVRVIGSIHLVPAVILGGAAGAFLIWKDRVTDRKSSRRINVAALAFLLLIAGMWAYAAFSPVFVIGGEIVR